MEKLIESWGKYLLYEKGFTHETWVKYIGNMNILIKKLKIRSVEELREGIINRRLLDNFWDEMTSTGKILSDQTRSVYLAALKNFLKFLYQYELLTVDISDKIVFPKKKDVYLEGLDKNEQKILREYLVKNTTTDTGRRDTALLMFLWGTGCRVGEALNLNVHPHGYIYYNDESIISGHFKRSDGRMYVHFQGKGKRDRRVAINDRVLGYLNLYLQNRKTKSDILFINNRNRRSKSLRLSTSAAVSIVNKVFDHAEIEKDRGLCTHIFRHTAINKWIEDGYSQLHLAVITGHKNPSSLDIYFQRNKNLTHDFAYKNESIIDLKDKKLIEYEKTVMARHSTYLK